MKTSLAIVLATMRHRALSSFGVAAHRLMELRVSP